MRYILILNAKGGSGKSTIATNLASYYAQQGQNVLLADYDPQGSSWDWVSSRSAAYPSIQVVAGYAEPVRPKRDTDFVIMDSPAGVYGNEFNKLLRRAETILIPVIPSPIDMRAAAEFINTIKSNNKIANKRAKAGLIANRVNERSNIYTELSAFLKKTKLPMLSHLRESMNYIRAAEKGIGIFEMPQYITQVDREQWQPILKWLKSKRSQATT